MPSQERTPLQRRLDWVRIGADIAAMAFVVIMTPVMLLFTTQRQLEDTWLYILVGYGLFFGFVIRDIVRVVSTRRREAAGPSPTEAPGRDAVWDRVEQGDRQLREAAGLGAPFARRTQGEELSEAVLRRTWAVPFDDSRPDVRLAAESAAPALGIARIPALYWARDSGTNAAVVGDVDSCSIILGEEMAATFLPDELLGVMTVLLSRVARGVADSVTGDVDDPGFLWPAERMSPALVIEIYKASDARAVLALRDPAPVVAALEKSAKGDPTFLGLTVDQAQLLWTWPYVGAPLLVDAREGGMGVLGGMDVLVDAFEYARQDASRVETIRLDALRASGAIQGLEERDTGEQPPVS